MHEKIKDKALASWSRLRRIGDGKPTTGRNWRHDESGSIGIIFALTTMVVVLIVGGAIDFGRAFTVRERTQAAVDSAVLAAARVWQTENDIVLAQEKGLKNFNANKVEGLGTSVGQMVADEVKNTLTLTATVKSPAPFLAIVGNGEIEMVIGGQAQLSRGETANRNLEIALMLDVTGSMAGRKLADLQVAAKDLVDIAVWDDQSQYTSRIALVPFAEAVNPGSYLSRVRGNRPSTNRFQDNNGYFQTYKLTDCVSDRKGNEAHTDAAPTGNDKAGPVYTRSGNCTPGSEIVPLTSEKDLLKSHIEAFRASGGTAGQIGTAWTWYMLSPLWNNIWPAPSQAGAYGDPKVVKVAVLMTDGEYNLAYDDAGISTRDTGNASSNGSADGQARLLCQGMKEKGITVFVVGFQLRSRTAEETLRRCATDSSYVYMAEDGEILRLAFRDIAQRLSTFHLSQ